MTVCERNGCNTELNKKQRRFCSLSCSTSYKNSNKMFLKEPPKEVECLGCGALTTNPKYCGHACSASQSNKTRERKRKCFDGVSKCYIKTCPCQDRRNYCVVCGSRLQKHGKRYCSHSCAAKAHWGSPEKIRLWLAGELNAGRDVGNDKKNLTEWARNYLLEEANWKCTQCGWDTPHPKTGKPPLEVDHIDGNRRNNARENLQVLCPNCHALTSTYRRYNYRNVQELRKNEWKPLNE